MITAVRRGSILVLNGTSSSGKTTLAYALQMALPQKYEVVGLDQWLSKVPRDLFVVVDAEDHPPVDGFLIPIRGAVQVALPKLGLAAVEVLRDMYASFARAADAGTNLIVDDVLWHPVARSLAIAQFAERNAWLIGVFCPPAIAIAREKDRADRALGGAALFGDVVHADTPYDITVNTALLRPDEAAAHVAAALLRVDGPTAFRKLRSVSGEPDGM